MKKYFLVKVKIEKTLEEGRVAKMSEQYLVDALSFTEAEARITEEMKPFVNGEFEVKNINPQKYSEIVSEEWSINSVDAEANKILGTNKNQSSEADKWFQCKLNFITLDEEKGVQKKTPVFMLVHANSPRTANDTLVSHMKGTLSDWELEKISETKIIEVFEYKN